MNAAWARLHTDYASWDDAVRSLYGTVDQAFVDENYLASTASSTFFDTAYLIDDQGSDVFAFRGGEAVTTPSGKAFGPPLAEMIAQVPADGRTYGVKTGVLKTIWGLEVVAVGPVVPNTSKQPAPSRSRYLVVARAFDEVEVKKLGEDFRSTVFILWSRTRSGAVTLRDPQGTAVGRSTWPPRRLGSEAHARVSPVVLLMLCLIVGVVRRLDRRHRAGPPPDPSKRGARPRRRPA